MKKIVNALITPFDDNNHIDYQELDKLLALAKDNCNDALVVGSTTGEGTLLSQDEKIECFKYVLKHTSLPCIYPINQMSFEKAKEEIDLVKELNFDIFLIVTPFYIKPTQEGLFVYFKELAKYVFPKKIIIYNVSSRTGTNISYFLRKDHKIPRECLWRQNRRMNGPPELKRGLVLRRILQKMQIMRWRFLQIFQRRNVHALRLSVFGLCHCPRASLRSSRLRSCVSFSRLIRSTNTG